MSARPQVFIHIGLGKTGTTTLQSALDEHRAALAAHGLRVPGERHADTRRAVYDLMGRRIGGAADDDVVGAWQPFAEGVVAAREPRVVFSEEMLALARPRQIKHLVGSLAPREPIVVVTLRDLGRVLGSYWQQMVMMGRTQPLDDFLRTVRDPASGPATAGVAFWLRQDVIRILNAWETAVPRENIRIVTVPGPGRPSELLADRFAEVLGVPSGLLRAPRPALNRSVGMPEVELVRRLNEALDGSLKEAQRLNLMRVVRRGLVGRASPPIVVPAEDFDWINRRTDTMLAALRERGYTVVGDLEDLYGKPGTQTAADVAESQVADAALAALTVLSEDHARLWSRVRGRRRRRREDTATAPEKGRLASQGRAATFRLKTSALEHADDSRVLGWAARTYLRLTSGR